MARGRTRLATAVAVALLISGASHAVAEEPGTARGTSAVPTAQTAVPMPDLGITHRLANGEMNLWRMPLSDVESGFGEPDLVRTLTTGGFSYDQSKTFPGDFGDLTPQDDGTADHLVWHAGANGSIYLWAIAGGADSTPRLWYTLRAPWNYANAQPMVGDVTGDGWDDLVVRLWRGCNGSTCYGDVWVFVSDGQKLRPPQRWWHSTAQSTSWNGSRNLLADVNGDGRKDWVEVNGTSGFTTGYVAHRRLSTGTAFAAVSCNPCLSLDAPSSGLGFATTRTFAGDVTGDGLDDIVTVARSGPTGLSVWVKRLGETVVQWQNLTSAGWSYASARHYMADTNADGRLDLVTVHGAGTGGFLVWRHLSTGTAFAAPQLVADLRTGGWNFSRSRAGVADTWGVVVD